MLHIWKASSIKDFHWSRGLMATTYVYKHIFRNKLIRVATVADMSGLDYFEIQGELRKTLSPMYV